MINLINDLKSDEKILISHINPDQKYLTGRLSSYLERFSQVDSKSLQLFDDTSDHYGLFYHGNLIGGFRLTTINHRASEIEELFPLYKFETNSFEFGRFWIDSRFKKLNLGYIGLDKLINSVPDFKVRNSYLKTGLCFTQKVKKYGYVYTGINVEHPLLKYQTYLFRRSKSELTYG